SLLFALVSASFLIASSIAVTDEDFGGMVVRASVMALFFSLVCAFAFAYDSPATIEQTDNKEWKCAIETLDRVACRLSVSNEHMCRAIDLLESTKREMRLHRESTIVKSRGRGSKGGSE